MQSKDYFILVDKYTEDYSFCFKLLFPYVIIKDYSEFTTGLTSKISFPTQIVLTESNKSINISIRVLGFGLSIYFRSNE